jgi:GNAT superfamily N-acetyltransferase
MFEDGVHPARPCDIASLVALCADHAHYEKAAYDPVDKARGLHHALFVSPPRLYAWLAWQGGVPIGYATASVEFSTFTACEYVHMDCLFVDAKARGHGTGEVLLDAVIAKARSLDLHEVQWQTPEWNAGAIRFYVRHGAHAKAKQRFVLALT